MSASTHEVRGATAGRNGTLHMCVCVCGVINTSGKVSSVTNSILRDRILCKYLLLLGSGHFFTFRKLDDGELIS